MPSLPQTLLLPGDARTLLRKRKLCPNNLCHLRGSAHKLGNNLGTNTTEYRANLCCKTWENAGRTNYLGFLHLPWAQEVSGSNPDAPTTPLLRSFDPTAGSGFQLQAPRPQKLRMKNLPILLARRFKVVRFLFLALGFPLWSLLFLYFHSICNGKFGFCVDSLGVNDQSQNTAEGRTDKIERRL
jgi:hypothetical protein